MLEHMKWAPDEIAQMLGTGYQRFVSTAGVHGLAKVVALDFDASELHILAVNSNRPGTGEFRKFLGLLKADRMTVRIWEVWNDRLVETLKRHGFVPCEGEWKGEKLTGMVWVAR